MSVYCLYVENNLILSTEHGPKGGDEINKIVFGENYGWKILGWGGKNYSGTEIGPKWKPGFTKAIYYWVPSIATSAIAIYKGKEFNDWNGHALVTSLKDRSLRKLIFKDVNEVKEDIIFKNTIGRIRDIQVQPNTGKLFLLSDSLENERRNLSYQRLFGQMIATQDNLADIVAHKTGRLIKTVVVKAASLMFLPI